MVQQAQYHEQLDALLHTICFGSCHRTFPYHHVIPYRFYPVSAGHGGGTILEGSEFARYCLHQTLSIDSEEMGVSLSEMVEDWLEAGSRE